MPLQKIGVNLSVLEDIELPDFNLTNNSKDLLNQIPEKANAYTGGYVGTVILSALFIFLYYVLSDTGIMGDFKYSKIRALGIATGICGVVGSIMLMIGYFTQLYPVVFCVVIFMLSLIWVIKEER